MISESACVVSISSFIGVVRRRAATTSAPYSTKLPGSTRSAMVSRAGRWVVLRRHDQRAVLDEAAGIDEIGDVLARRALVGPAPPRDGVGAAFVGRLVLALQ